MKTLRCTLALATTTLLAAAGCSSLTGSDAVEAPGIIIYYGDTTTINLPGVVQHGAAFDISLTTFGGGCTGPAERTDVDVAALTVRITPYDHHVASQSCTAELRFLEHRQTIRIDRVGVAVVRFSGTLRDGRHPDRPVELTRTIVVQ